MKKLIFFLSIILFFLFLNSLLVAAPQEIKVSISCDSANKGFEPWRMMDGDLQTMWHTQFTSPAEQNDHLPAISVRCGYSYGCNAEHQYFQKKAIKKCKHKEGSTLSPRFGNNVSHPHWLRVDMQKECTLTGFIYTPRKGAENGTIKEYVCYVTQEPDIPEKGSNPASKGVLVKEKNDVPIHINFEKPQTGRYFILIALSELSGGPYASVAELELLSEGIKFIAESQKNISPGMLRTAKLSYMEFPAECASMTAEEKAHFSRRVEEFNDLIFQLSRPEYYEEIKDQTAHPASLIIPEDRDPTDVVYRRVCILAEEMSKEFPKLDFSAEVNRIKQLKDSVTKLVDITHTDERFQLFLKICEIRREMMFRHPRLDFDEILFVKKHRATYNHLCDQFYGVNFVPGGGVFVLSDMFGKEAVKNPYYPAQIRNVLENAEVTTGRLRGTMLHGGAFLSPDLSYDAKEIVFAYVECEGTRNHFWHTDLTRGHWEQKRCLHIFKCNLDGTCLKMLTDGTWNDFDPVFLPNGRIAFISERRGGYLRCGRECPNFTLFDMDAEGEKLRCLSYHETNEWNPSVTHDGKIIYTRWDYIDRFGCIAHHPWITTLNGSDPRAVHGNFTPRHLRADSELDCRAIPDSGKYVATAGPHHGQSFGSLIIIDPEKDDEDQDPMNSIKRITPDVGFPESQNGAQVYGTPYPLSEKLYLAVADFSMQNTGREGQKYSCGDYGIYLIDIYGNRELVYHDPEISCITPIPVKKRPLPVIRPEIISPEQLPDQPYVKPGDPDILKRPQATVSVANVYQSLKPWPENTKIKSLRVMQLYCMSVPSGRPPHETGPREPSSRDSVNLVRGVLGTVPVEEDGSAHFTVPAQVEVYFQALDENGLAVQSMRSGTYFQPGDNISCVGCHENKNETPLQASTLPLAFQREPSALRQETAPGTRPINFPQLVQPVLDKHCVECHAKPESVKQGAFSLARQPYRNKWYESYNNLVLKGYAFYDYKDPLRTTPGEFGARTSKLYKILMEGHYDVKLSPEEMARITLWLDSLSLFYGCYEKENGEKQLRAEDVYPTLE
ncbi:MAG: discoidin domain-containing protein [Planctomycetia bacterium]|nr:discoidin domain-containing protein [Planctomycetia bacterium]